MIALLGLFGGGVYIAVSRVIHPSDIDLYLGAGAIVSAIFWWALGDIVASVRKR